MEPLELRDALDQISEIRERMARGDVFRGYRAATTAFTAAVGVAGAAVQAVWVPRPAEDVDGYVILWAAAALLSIIVVGAEMAWRSLRSSSALHRRMTRLAVDQFVPSLVAGALSTYVIAEFKPDAVAMLPGLWAILFSLGIFASRRFLPSGIAVAAAFYLLAGLCALAKSRGGVALSPW